MNFSSIVRCDHKIFYISRKVLLNLAAFSYNSFYKICCDIVKNTQSSISMQRPQSVFLKNIFADIADFAFIGQVIFSRNFENNWNKNVNFHQLIKIILINENSYLQMYPNKKSFLTYWFLRIKWLIAKYVKISKETATHKQKNFAKF